MSFRCGGSDDLPSALRRSSAVEYFVSQLPGGSIGEHLTCCIASFAKGPILQLQTARLCRYELHMHAIHAHLKTVLL